MEDISFKGTELYLDSKLLYVFERNIQMFLQFKDLIFVVVRDDSKETYNKNLFCIDINGNLIWQCEDMLANRDPDSLEPPYAHYTYIWLKDDQLWGSNYFGTHDNRLDMQTGKIVESHYMK